MLKSTFLDICRKKNLECTIYSWFDCSGDDDTPSKMAVSAESESFLYCALGDIDVCSQKVIGMRHFEQLKFGEIALRLEMNTSSVASIYRRGIEKLHKAMSAYQAG
jgi:DNA-directed RNA polymerase specialized sigma24 family protein